MSDDETPIPISVDGVAARMSKKERREARRQAAREAAEAEERDANEPEPEPTVCVWCGFQAVFDDETPDAEKAKCPACGIAYDQKLAIWNPPDDPDCLTRQEAYQHRAVHRRIATSLDNLFALLNEQWEEAKEAAAEARGGYR